MSAETRFCTQCGKAARPEWLAANDRCEYCREGWLNPPDTVYFRRPASPAVRPATPDAETPEQTDAELRRAWSTPGWTPAETRCSLCGEIEDAPQHQPPNRYGRHEFRPARPAVAEPEDAPTLLAEYDAAKRAHGFASGTPETAARLTAARTAIVAELTALRAVREAAERYVKAWDAKDAADCAEPPDIALVQQRGREKAQAFAALRAALAPAASSDPNPEGNRRE